MEGLTQDLVQDQTNGQDVSEKELSQTELANLVARENAARIKAAAIELDQLLKKHNVTLVPFMVIAGGSISQHEIRIVAQPPKQDGT